MKATFPFIFSLPKKLKWMFAIVGLILIVGLGGLRVYTHAQFAFASLMLIPVLANTWLIGRFGGWLSGFLAAFMWGYADYMNATSADSVWLFGLNTVIHFINYGIVVELLHKVQELLEREINNARQDRLTGLLNRRGFMQAFNHQIELAQRLNTSFSISFIDLDQFKQLNDTKGHLEGDAALKSIGAVLMKEIRSTDVVGRLGGDEFCIAGFTSSSKDAETEALRLHTQLTQALSNHAPVGVSMGVVFFDRPALPASQMIQMADETMYAVKQAGKGQVLVKTHV